MAPSLAAVGAIGIRKISGGMVTTVAGTGVAGFRASPTSGGRVFVADSTNNRVTP